MNDKLDSLTAFKETLPTAFGYVGLGVTFGIVGGATGFSPLVVLLTSIIIYAGSAQFITVSMLAVGSPLLSIVFATFLVNARMILLSTTLAPYFKKNKMSENILVGTLLTDESFVLGMNKLNFTDHHLSFAWFNTANVVAYLTWAISSFVGALLGNFIPDPQKFGLDFAIVAMFIGLLYLQIITDRSLPRMLQLLMVGITLVLIYLGFIFIPSNILILVVTVVGCGIGVVIKHAFF